MSNETDNSVVGEAGFGGEGRARKVNADNAYWRVKDGDNVYRVLPPFGKLKDYPNKWCYYEQIIWGFKGTNGKMRPFRSPEQKQNGKVTLACPAIKWITSMVTAEAEALKALKERKPALAKDEIENLMKVHKDFTERFKIDKHFTVNVLRQDGQIGRLKLKIKHKQAFEAFCKEMVAKKNINPISATGGLWINFKKTKTGQSRNDIAYTVEAVMETKTIDGEEFSTLKKAPLTDEVIKRMKTEAFELADSYKELTVDQVEQLVFSKGDPKIVDSLWGAPSVEVSVPAEESHDDIEEPAMNTRRPSVPSVANDADAEDFIKQFGTGA